MDHRTTRRGGYEPRRSRQSPARRQWLTVGGAALAAVAVLVLLICLLSSSGRNRKYEDFLAAAQRSYIAEEYQLALDYANDALALRGLKDEQRQAVYLLMADVYADQERWTEARDLLALACEELDSEALRQRLSEIEQTIAQLEAGEGSVTIGGVELQLDALSVVLNQLGLTSEDLAPLDRLTQLQTLTLSDNSITDLSALSGLTELTYLQLSRNQVSDLTPLAQLQSLRTLYLDGNPITDITPLLSLQGLSLLSLNGVELTREQLEQLEQALPACSIYSDSLAAPEQITIGGQTVSTSVTELSLVSCGISDISELAYCTELVSLDLQDNNISDLSPLAQLTKLERLILWDNQVTDISPLAGLTKLTYLDIDDNQIVDLTPLENLKSLTQLWVERQSPMTIAPIAGLTNLTRLGLRELGLTDADLQYLRGLTKLTELRLDGNNSISGEAVASLQAVLPNCNIVAPQAKYSVTLGGVTYSSDATSISCPSAGITDISGLRRFTALTSLDLSGNAVSDLSPLSACTQLQTLNLSSNQITSVSALSGLSSLRTLDLSYNSALSDFTPLYGLQGLTTLNVSGCGLNWEQLELLRISLPACAVLSDLSEPAGTQESVQPGEG